MPLHVFDRGAARELRELIKRIWERFRTPFFKWFGAKGHTQG
jgi:hypothetical protein